MALMRVESEGRTLRARLRDLIAALDRRKPQSHRAAETGIAGEAALLKRQALDRIAQLDGKTVEES